MKLRLSEFTLVGETLKEDQKPDNTEPVKSVRTSQVPTVAQFEWVKPGPSDTLKRADYFFLSYLSAASFPSKRGDTFDLCAPPSCDADARAGLQSLRVFVGDQSSKDTGWSAAWVRELLNPPKYSDSHDVESLGFTLNKTAMKAFDHWDDAWFVSNSIDENNDTHGSSTFYRTGYRIYAGHALAEIEIPVRVGDRPIPIYIPVYSSVEDAEKSLGLSVVAIRRRTCYLTKTFFKYLSPAGTGADLTSLSTGNTMSCTTEREAPPASSPETYFTLWLKKPSWVETTKARNGKARGYILLTNEPTAGTAVTSVPKKELLLAPGDVLIIRKETK